MPRASIAMRAYGRNRDREVIVCAHRQRYLPQNVAS